MLPAHRRQVLLTLLALWVGGVAYLTLTPYENAVPLTLRSFSCVGCGVLDGSDMIRNWILFIPGGLLTALVFGPALGVLLPVCLAISIEFVQIGIPGRDPALQDLLLNALGATTGVLLMRGGLSRMGQRAVAAGAALAWLAPMVLLIPMTTPFDLYGLWTPRLGGVAHYGGRIDEAFVGGLSVESRIVDEKAMLDTAIVRRDPIRLVLEAGPAPTSLAPIFQIADGQQQSVLEIAALDHDLLLRWRNPAAVLRLDRPDARWHGAMAGVDVGDTVDIVVDRGRASVCMSVGERERCNLAPSLGSGWGHVLNLEGPPAWMRGLMALGWAAGLGGLLGLTATSRASALIFTTALAVAGQIGSHLSPDVRPSALHAAVLVGGALLGALLRSSVIRLWAAVRPTSEPELG